MLKGNSGGYKSPCSKGVSTRELKEREQRARNRREKKKKKTGERDRRNIEFSLEHIMSEMEEWL